MGKPIFYFDGSRRTYRCIKDRMISWSTLCFRTSEICEIGMRRGVSQKKMEFLFLLDLIKAHFRTKHAGSFDEDATGCATRKWRIQFLTCIIIGKLHKLRWKLQTHTQDWVHTHTQLVPSGKLTVCELEKHMKNTCLIANSTISMAMFKGKLLATTRGYCNILRLLKEKDVSCASLLGVPRVWPLATVDIWRCKKPWG